MNASRLFVALIAVINLSLLGVSAIDSHDSSSRQAEPYPLAQPEKLGHLNLVGYLDSSLSFPAEKVQMGDPHGALIWLSKAKLKYSTAIAQSHYLKALSFQSLKQFDSSVTEYKWIEKHSSDAVLRSMASIGLKIAEQKISVIKPEQIAFPAGRQLPSPIE
jgi:hypothetical protein